MTEQVMKRMVMLASILALASSQMVSAGGIKCWKTNDGLTECGDAVPPEYTQSGHREYNSQGIVVRQIDRAKTKQEIAAEQHAERLRKEQERIAQEQALRDRILLDTFSTEEEITMTRDGKIALIHTEVKIANRNIEVTRARLESLEKGAANMERRGKPVSEQLQSDIASAKSQIAEYSAFVSARLAEQDAIRSAYDADLKRFRELKSLANAGGRKQALSQ